MLSVIHWLTIELNKYLGSKVVNIEKEETSSHRHRLAVNTRDWIKLAVASSHGELEG